jgi:putative membrane protein
MSILFAALIALLHIYFFYLESIAWGKPATNKLFRVSDGDAKVLQGMAFNQGFYNLFLAIAIQIGLGLRFSQRALEGNLLIGYGAASVLGAGFVLFLSGPAYRRSALIQALPALGYLGFFLLGY